MGSLFVIQGPDQGRRFELKGGPATLGRDAAAPIRLHDNEVSRRHAEVRRADDGASWVVDLGSANGTFLNGLPVDRAPLQPGDQLRLGQTVIVYQEAAGATARDLTSRVDLLSRASPEDRSAIIRSIPASDGSRVLEAPASAGEWLKVRLGNLATLYRTTQAISTVEDVDALLPQILQLVLDSIGADRGAILLAEGEAGELAVKHVRFRVEAESDERMAISRSIVDHVRTRGEGVISSDAPADPRFGPAQSIVDFGIREAICVPIQGRYSTLGVLYADLRGGGLGVELSATGDAPHRGRFAAEHLTLMVAIGHQAGLAIENTALYQAKLQAERLAAVGQTIATLSHHIKNIVQGMRGGGSLVELGMDKKDDAILRRGWAIVEKNQAKIYNLVLDMLSFSKEREPALEPADLNATVEDAVELMRSRAGELGVDLEWRPWVGLPAVAIDEEGIHRAVLNIVTNAIDAAEGRPEAKVQVSTRWEESTGVARVVVKDNGEGISPELIPTIFDVFASTKGARGTGLGLPVSRKIAREHGGDVVVSSEVGVGSKFVLELPTRARADGPSTGADIPTME